MSVSTYIYIPVNKNIRYWLYDSIFIFYSLNGILSENYESCSDKLHNPISSIQGHNDSVYSMASSKDFCITGATGVIAVSPSNLSFVFKHATFLN